LSEKKKYATNNLVGATWEQSISFEMSAVTSKYDALIDSAEAKINRLLKEKVRIEGSLVYGPQPNKSAKPFVTLLLTRTSGTLLDLRMASPLFCKSRSVPAAPYLGVVRINSNSCS